MPLPLPAFLNHESGDLKVGRILILFLLITIITAGCATQKDVTLIEENVIRIDRRLDTLENNFTARVSQLERDIKELQKPSFLVELEDFRTALDELNGRLEKNSYQLQKLSGEIEAYKQESNRDREALVVRITSLEKGFQELERALEKERKKLKVTKFKLMGPKGIYQEALRLYKKGEYENARKLFEKLLKEYPNSPLAGNAQFWIGEVYFCQKRFEEAILAYQKTIKKYPKNVKIAGALLKQALSFAALGDKDTAKILLKQLIQRYPKTEQARIAQRKLKNL